MKTKIVFHLFVLLISFKAFAVEEVWKLGSDFMPLSQNAEKKWLISLHCEEKDCMAKDALRKVSMKLLEKGDLQGGKNPGAVLCNKLKNADIVFLSDLQGNQNSFCKFKDGSIVSSSTLVIYAEKNDKK
jgi:hypothetical protein